MSPNTYRASLVKNQKVPGTKKYTPHERHIYSQQLGTVEPVFGHIRETLRLNRFSLRDKKKVDGQWKLFTTTYSRFSGTVGG